MYGGSVCVKDKRKSDSVCINVNRYGGGAGKRRGQRNNRTVIVFKGPSMGQKGQRRL